MPFKLYDKNVDSFSNSSTHVIVKYKDCKGNMYLDGFGDNRH